MKALVVARLLMGDFERHSDFVSDWEIAGKIINRRTARSVSAQIGRGYGELSREIQKFLEANFLSCNFNDLVGLGQEIALVGSVSRRLDEFERIYFPLTPSVKSRFPFYTHLHISVFGLKFQYPEHHFIRDLETALPELLKIASQIEQFRRLGFSAKNDRSSIAEAVAREQFLSRSVVSASYSLVEAFLSGLLYTVSNTDKIGKLVCDEPFLAFSRTKESSPLKHRLDTIARFSSQGKATGDSEPFLSFLTLGKKYRDAVHHTTPFGRKDIEPGGRLTALYEIDYKLAAKMTVLAVQLISTVLIGIGEDRENSEIATRCGDLLPMAMQLDP